VIDFQRIKQEEKSTKIKSYSFGLEKNKTSWTPLLNLWEESDWLDKKGASKTTN